MNDESKQSISDTLYEEAERRWGESRRSLEIAADLMFHLEEYLQSRGETFEYLAGHVQIPLPAEVLRRVLSRCHG